MAEQEKYAINEKEFLGKLEFLGCDAKPMTERKGKGRNARDVPIGFMCHLVSEHQDDVNAVIPIAHGKPDFPYMSVVTLGDPRLEPIALRGRKGAYLNGLIWADSIKKI